MTTNTTTTTATLTEVTTVGDCQGLRDSSDTDLAAAWLRRCFLVTGRVGYLPEGTGCLRTGLRGDD